MRIWANTSASATRAMRKSQAPARLAKRWAICTTQTVSFAALAAERCAERPSTTFTEGSIAKRITWYVVYRAFVGSRANLLTRVYFAVFGIPANGREMCNLRPFDHGNGRVINRISFFVLQLLPSCRFCKRWASHTIQAASGAASAMSASTVFRSRWTSTIRFTASTTITACTRRSVPAAARVSNSMKLFFRILTTFAIRNHPC